MISETNDPLDKSPEPGDEVTTETAVDALPTADDSAQAESVGSERSEPDAESTPLDGPSISTEPAAANEQIAMTPSPSIEQEAQEMEQAPAEVETPPASDTPPSEPQAESDAEAQQGPSMDWYILKVQSNREDSIRESLLRRAKIADLEQHFGEVIVPTETVTEFKNGKKRVVKRKLYPGYIVVHMEINDDTWFLVRDTHGIGDFTGAGGKPVPMQTHEVSRLLARQEEKTEEAPKLKISFKPGDRVKINEGTFENFEGDVDSIDETNGRVTVMINIFGRSTPVELEYWQVATV